MDRRHRQPALDVQESGEAPRPARHLGYRQPVGDVVPPGTPVLLPEGAAHDPQLPQPRQEVERELCPVPVTRGRRDDVLVYEGTYLVTNLLLLFGEEASNVHEVHRPRLPARAFGRDTHLVPPFSGASPDGPSICRGATAVNPTWPDCARRVKFHRARCQDPCHRGQTSRLAYGRPARRQPSGVAPWVLRKDLTK